MSKVKYKYNPQTLTYEKAEAGTKEKFFKFMTYIGFVLIIGIGVGVAIWAIFPSPREKQKDRELAYLKLQLDKLSQDVSHLSSVASNLQDRDDNIYRTVFEAEPIPDNIRKAGFGGANRYKNLEGYDESGNIIRLTKKIDELKRQMYIQSKSFDDIYELAKNKTKMLASIPAIQPVSNKDLKRMASGFGMRIHPTYKVPMFHPGMDFSAPTGTEVYATGDGVVEKVLTKRGGYGKHIVIKHGFGYQTLYGHLSKFNVRRGQKVKRGDVIGYVGNTGRSTGPHLHYEVIKSNKKINPVYYYSNDLSPEQYEEMVKISSRNGQSFD